MKKHSLPESYSFREMESAEFRPLWIEHSKPIFDDDGLIFRPMEFLPESEKESIKTLGKLMGTPYSLRLCIFHGDKFVGWHTGNQESADTYYMRNSAVLPEHRGRGLYSALLAEVMSRLSEKGFQRIYSRHTATNNAVLIPKLKAGFVITGLELSDNFGTLVHLTYMTNALRRKMLDFRCGEIRPDEELRKALKIP